MSSEYWTIEEGQLKTHERCHLGSPDRAFVKEFKLPDERVVRLKTREYALPADHPDFNENMITKGYRYCLVYEKKDGDKK